MTVTRIENLDPDGGVRVEYDADAENSESMDAEKRPESAATRILKMAQSSVELFHYGEDSFATIKASEHFETYRLKSPGFRSWLGKSFFQREKRAASGEALTSAIATLEGLARFENAERQVFIRVAGDIDRVRIDLCDEKWRQVEISASGYRIVNSNESPVRFRRAHGMLPLPLPERGGSLNELRAFLNVASDQDFSLLLGWCLGALHPLGPYPVLILHGEQGSAKSTSTRTIRSLIDPNVGALRSEPREPRDLMIAATNGWIITLDNISRLEPWLSDCLCRLSTGGGFGTRTLYTDADEMIFQARRPTILNGIEELATRGDLVDRSILTYLPRIPEEERRDERTFNTMFEAVRPRLFGALLHCVSAAIRNHALVDFKALPRMADFARWVAAAESTVGWTPGTFASAYRGNQRVANDLPLETPVAEAIRGMTLPYENTATKLLEELNGNTDERTRKSKSWPSSGRALSNALRRLAPNLRGIGISVEFDRSKEKSRRRLIRLSEIARKPSSASSAASDVSQNADIGADDRWTASSNQTSSKTINLDVLDGLDDEMQSLEGVPEIFKESQEDSLDADVMEI